MSVKDPHPAAACVGPAVESYTMHASRSRKGFTLVELLIVVIILGILAAVVIPQIGQASSEAKESALRASLNTVRQAISLYRVQHNEAYPGPAWANVVTQLTTQTDVNGATAGVLKYGPYLRTGFPENPEVDPSIGTTGKVVATMPAAPSGTEAWIYSLDNGELRANQPGQGPSGQDFFDL
jgi:general secretion pathway protein G